MLVIKKYWLVILIIAIIGLMFLKHNQLFFDNELAIDNQAPNISHNLVNGSSFELSSLRGNYVLVYFWGSWCMPCLRELPKLVSLHNDFLAREFIDANVFDVVSVALEKKEENWKKVVSRYNFSWENQLVEQTPFVRMSKIAANYGVTEIPYKFLIGPTGEIVAINPSDEELRMLLSQKVKR